jgi:hypothetical protein
VYLFAKSSVKFRRFVILVSIRSGWIHLSTLSSFAGPLQLVVYFDKLTWQRWAAKNGVKELG